RFMLTMSPWEGKRSPSTSTAASNLKSICFEIVVAENQSILGMLNWMLVSNDNRVCAGCVTHEFYAFYTLYAANLRDVPCVPDPFSHKSWALKDPPLSN